MLSTEAASLAISIARGLIKLGGRLDVLMAERTATEGKLIIPMPPVSIGPPLFKRAELLEKYLVNTASKTPDPLGPDRATLAALIVKTPTPNEVDVYFRRIFPKLSEPPLVDPDAEYLKALKTRLPTVDWSDASTREAAFAIASGRDTRELGYAARTALLVVDTLAEFGAENTSRFVRDPNLQTVVQSVLERFAKPQLEDFEQWNPFLRHVLSATLNGALDASENFLGRHEWLDAVLTALTQARADVAGGDDFVLGLLRGRGYALLIGEGLTIAAARLGSEHAPAFQQITAEVLLAAAPLVKANRAGFAGFFREHWGDLLRAGLVSVGQRGPMLLQGQAPLLQETLLAMIGELAKTTDSEFFTTDTVFKLTEATLGSVATNPDLLKGTVKEAWFRELIAGAAKTVGDVTIRGALTREGLEGLVMNALTVLAAHPELLVDKPGRRFDLVSTILRSVGGINSPDAKSLASAAIAGAFNGLAEQRLLLDTRYGELIAEFSGAMAKLVSTKGITGVQAADLVTVAAESILRNPELFTQIQDNLAVVAVESALAGAKASDSKLLAGAALARTTRALLEALALRGRNAVANVALKDLTAKLTDAVAAGLKRGEKELGLSTDRVRLPLVLGGVVAAVLKGDLTVLNPDTSEFVTLFNSLAEAAA